MISLALRILERVPTSVSPWADAARQRKYFRRRFAGFQQEVRRRLYPGNMKISVLSGPFQGMRYLDEVVWGSITSKWLGSYEIELDEALTQLAAPPVDTVIDVGCAEGYYAVGAALMNASAKVYAFDVDPFSRRQVSRMSVLNGVADRVVVGKFCSHSDLQQLSSRGTTLVICDIEGGEVELLDPVKAPCLRDCDVLVEVHEASQASHEVELLLKRRFAATHKITTVRARSREAWIERDAPNLLETHDRDFLQAATDEHRGNGQTWLAMRSVG
ncbi:hypothetical protein Pla123a_44100 [Posidoniimonas polymericola]|uniref:Methyltransferase FkbM domain-containing protein n=1 Tax=Posidoniimonas polymericola TaxID=2528002 RepID=A0A5C5XWU2_9BACT|nr:50S ribosomal protein L11 methyltransferase [Posidoniimonas polymericola]TWT66981.1 hypothetical protein Pla123a_44100 [Posidoniimonas polymericola]